MLKAIRKREKLLLTIFVTAIAIVFVFWGFYGDFNISSIGKNDAASVNGEKITIQEFQNEYQNTLRFYENILKNKLTPEMMKQFNVKQMVLNQLVDQKLVLQGAKSLKLKVIDSEVSDTIVQTPVFQKDGKFDKDHYLNLLKANRLTPVIYENKVRLDLLQRKIIGIIRNYIKVSESEVYKEYILKNNQMNLDFIRISPSSFKEANASDLDIKNFLSNKENITKAQRYYAANQHLFKQKEKDKEILKPFEEVKENISRTLIQEQKSENSAKDTAENILKNRTSSSLKKILSEQKLKWEETGFFTISNRFIPKIGESLDLMSSMLKLKKNEFPSRYFVIQHQYFIVKLKDKKEASPKTFQKDKDKITSDTLNQKQSDAYYEWLKEIKSTAKVSISKAMLQEE